MRADLSIPTGVIRHRDQVGRADRWWTPRTPGPHELPVGHIVSLELTDDAAHRQFGMAYWSEGHRVWASGWGSPVVEVLADDAGGRGQWVEHGDRRSVLVRPEDLLGARDLGPLEKADVRAYDRITKARTPHLGGDAT